MDNLHIFLGATVADAAARPLHWVYDSKKLNKYIKLIFLDIKSLKYSPKYQHILNMNENTIQESNILLKKLFEYSNQKY